MTTDPEIRGPFRAARPIVLASASPRRRDLLGSLGLDFEVLPVDGEPGPINGEAPADYAVRAALIKAREASGLRPEAVVLGADTIVVLEDDILGKPADQDQAMLMLTRLAGREHLVLTGCALIAPGAEPRTFCVETRVSMGPQPLEALMAYAACGEPMDKAGAYAIQGAGGFLVAGISGSYSNVVGLPLAETVEALAALSALRPAAQGE